MGLNPVSTSNFIFQRFSDYAATTLRVDNEVINKQLRALLKDSNQFSKGPIIEATPSYAVGSSILDLVEEGILTDAFRDFNSTALPLDRKLYKHQELAIRKICLENRNAVVATGTGSGKTESFMIPILNHLLKLKKKNKLHPGVKALLLYPMNALANDQMKRLRELLANEPEITFGIYTGETEEKYSEAYDKFVRMHRSQPLKNELISREQMKKTPPHILLTNYAMLEYLMLRPEDNVFFQGEFAGDWKFIIIDEAHTYTGTNGIEMAMLISRLKNTIGLKKGELKCILTSATLGNGKEDFPEIANFAQKLCGEDFSSEDVIEAVKQDMQKGEVWGSPKEEVYEKILDNISENNFEELKKNLLEAKVPPDIIEKAYKENADNPKGVLYDILLGDKRVNETISILSVGPMDFKEISKKIFPNSDRSEYYMASLIDICNAVRKSENHSPLIPARYHYFIRALEGAFVVFADKPYLYLERMNKVTINGEEYKAFEIATCRRCNALYLVGQIEKDKETGYAYLTEYKDRYYDEEDRIDYFAVLDDKGYSDDINEDEIVGDIEDIDSAFTIFRLCTKCGAIKEDVGKKTCDCKDSKHIKLLKIKNNKRCGICGSMTPKGSIIRRFFLAEDTVASVLATALYNKIPNKVNLNKEQVEDDLFGYVEEENKTNKQLLIFSDNRQSAAYFATYLNSSYKEILIKSILTKVMLNNWQESIKNDWSLEDYYYRIEKFVRDNNLLKGTKESNRREIWKWIIGEFISSSPNSLTNMGYLHFSLNFNALNNSEILFNLPMLVKKGFSREELMVFYNYLLDQFRIYRAIEYPEYVDPSDSYFSPVNVQGGFCRVIENRNSRHLRGYDIKSWIPSEERFTNSRLDYLMRIYKSKGIYADKVDVRNDLEKLYKLFTQHNSPLVPYVKNEYLDDFYEVIKIDPSIFKVTPGVLDKSVHYYKCDKCYKVTTININNVCPSYRCDGHLHEIDLEKELKDNHYRKLYTSFEFENMVVSEHTAQLKTEYAAEVQNKFIKREINVLSCSTTFELGVDVGELETVFMKNMPPTPANYAQRAGRAGRRTDSTAYALTYCRLASHDFSNFKDPYKMISGTVKPPHFEVTNEKIAKRHMYACALAAFWRKYREYFRTVEDFFVINEKRGPELFREFLDEKPDSLYRLIKKVIPQELHSELGIDNWGWVEELYSEDGVMTKITNEFYDDLGKLEEAKNEAAKANKFKLADELQRIINTIVKRSLISYFSQKNLLPKYGFPVDVVNLEVNFHTQEAKNIELERDLQIAISEYAPESQVVANGKLWTSRYVKKLRNRDLVRKKYFSCECGFFKTMLTVQDEEIRSCPVCGNSKIIKGTYMIPEFGFITEASSKEPGNTRPEKTYSSRKHFSGNGNVIEEKEFMIGENVVKVSAKKHGTLTVINSGKGLGFYICKMCGYGTVDKIPSSHKDSNGKTCKAKFEKISLGYDFETDIVEIEFGNIFGDIAIEEGFWESLMYSILEGMSSALEIDRNDVDGTLYVKNPYTKSIILFDTVPGGAGHVKRLLDEEQFIKTLTYALNRVSSCTCGGEKQDTSCYNCLRNYYNQYCHDKLKRGYAIEALKILLNKERAKSY